LQQKEIHEAAWQHMRAVEKGERLIVGVNHGVQEGNESIPIQNLDLELGERQKVRLSVIRSKRNATAALGALDAIRDGARGNQNMFPLVIDAVKVDCTLGEIMSVMKEVFGTYMAPSGF
jgi:methylmalonyl-CoA mutase N-terminal domain/subunit